ncbi:hypothetical protein [Tatumella sp. OPLPL6]|uniref:hypothetical protein n=1 Tax=Tatumella sp. OPLPL6 TaxID=1928657 RepID=UPI000C19EC97|nr:hypothetical protein [Tatumella sp. OPLPL6]PIJ42820.1 hypothetical protein BOM24_10070 [Tatumella sp. OPLPL6]
MTAEYKKNLPIKDDAPTIHAEAVVLTAFNTNGVDFANVSFMYPIIKNKLEANGSPSDADMELTEVGSVIMTRQALENFHNAIGKLLGKER